MQQERTLVSFDWAIKYLLRNKADYVILEGFLTTLLGKKIKIQNLAESESNNEPEDKKYNRVDVSLADSIVLVTSDHHEFDIVEQREKISFYWIR